MTATGWESSVFERTHQQRSEQVSHFGPGPGNPARYPSYRRRNWHSLGISSDYSKHSRPELSADELSDIRVTLESRPTKDATVRAGPSLTSSDRGIVAVITVAVLPPR